MNDQSKTAEEIRRRMFQIRGELNSDISGVIANAKRMMNWRYYLETFPKSSLVVTALLGYLVIPKRSQVVMPDADALEELAKKYKLVVEQKPKVSRAGMASPIMKLALTTLLRVGMMKASELYGEYRERQNSAEPTEEAVST